MSASNEWNLWPVVSVSCSYIWMCTKWTSSYWAKLTGPSDGVQNFISFSQKCWMMTQISPSMWECKTQEDANFRKKAIFLFIAKACLHWLVGVDCTVMPLLVMFQWEFKTRMSMGCFPTSHALLVHKQVALINVLWDCTVSYLITCIAIYQDNSWYSTKQLVNSQAGFLGWSRVKIHPPVQKRTLCASFSAADWFGLFQCSEAVRYMSTS